MPKLETLIKCSERPILRRIIKQFGNVNVDNSIEIGDMSNAQVFFELTKRHGRGKAHCSSHYPKDEGTLKGT